MDLMLGEIRARRAGRKTLPGFLSGWSGSRFRGLASGRSAARLARLVRDQEVGGSNPLAPTENQMLDGLRVSSISFRKQLPSFTTNCRYKGPREKQDKRSPRFLQRPRKGRRIARSFFQH